MSVVPPLSGPPLYRYVPGVGKVATTQNGPTGPIGLQGIPGTATNTGATGPTGPSPNVSLPSTFATTNSASTLATGPTGTQLADITITTTQTGYIWSTSSVELKNMDNSAAHDVYVYQVVNGFTSDGVTTSLQKKSNNGTYQQITVSYRTDSPVAAGTHPIQVYAYTLTTTSEVSATHRDTFAVAHLS